MEENGQFVQFIFNTEREVISEKENEWTIYIRGSELLASSNDYAKTYYHYANDEMGSITHIVDDKQILNQYEYDAWGNVVSQEETIKNRFKFNGQQLDPITQQYYLRARFYNPIIGRFTQEDTYRGDGLNLYSYCANNPVYYVDPSGNVICPKTANEIREKIRFGNGTIEERKAFLEYEANINEFMLRNMEQKALEVIQTQSKKSAGPCLSQIYDPVTGKIEYGFNFKTNKTGKDEYKNWLENDADDLIKNLEKEYSDKIEAKEIILSPVADKRYAAHSEIVALDKILKNRRKLGLPVSREIFSELYLYNIDISKVFNEIKDIPKDERKFISKGQVKSIIKDRCENCRYLTNGINVLNHK